MRVSNRGNMGLRIIVFMGAATFLFLMLMAFGLKKSLQPQAGARIPEGAATSPFNEDRAWRDIEILLARDFTGVNSRQDYVAGELRKAGLRSRGFDLNKQNAESALPLTSIVGIITGSRPGVIVLCAAMNPCPTGNDTGAADAAWLLEMARILGGQREGRSIWVVFFDGEVAPGQEYNTVPYQAGGQLVEALRTAQELAAVEAGVAVRGIGDCSLAVQKDAGAPEELAEILWNTAEREGYGKYFGTLPARARDGQLAFREAGIPALALVDDSPHGGGTKLALCRESLRAVGDVIYHALAPIEGHLDETGMRIDGH